MAASTRDTARRTLKPAEALVHPSFAGFGDANSETSAVVADDTTSIGNGFMCLPGARMRFRSRPRSQETHLRQPSINASRISTGLRPMAGSETS